MPDRSVDPPNSWVPSWAGTGGSGTLTVTVRTHTTRELRDPPSHPRE
jgi:hypothetical protein